MEFPPRLSTKPNDCDRASSSSSDELLQLSWRDRVVGVVGIELLHRPGLLAALDEPLVVAMNACKPALVRLRFFTILIARTHAHNIKTKYDNQ
jgi:hypothetical protein